MLSTLLVLSVARITPAAELRLTLANDPVSGNSRKDDLYTSETSFELQLNRRSVAFSERMFTNRERNIRFDETWAGVSFAPATLGDWNLTTELGLLHVGKGLLGESVQNGVHRFVGSEEVHLPYVDEESFHPTASLTLDRRIGSIARMPVRASLHMETAPAFRSSLHAGVGVVRNLGRNATVELDVGARGDYVENEWLEDVVGNAGPTAGLVVTWRGVALAFSHNRYGTQSNHVTLGWRSSLSR